MKIQWVIFGIVGLVVLWLISRMSQQSEPQVVPEFISVPSEQERLGIFSTLASLAAEANAAILQRLGIEAQLEATRIGAETDRVGIRAQSLATQLSAGVQRAAIEAERVLGLRQIGAEESLGLRQIGAQETLFLEDLRNRAAQESQTLAAVERAAREFRNQSLERQGTILNAIRGSLPFTFVDAFGGPRSQPWYAPITQGVGKLISGLRLPIPGAG